MDTPNTDASTKAAVLVSSVYAVVGSLWILFSDALVQRLTTSPAQVTRLQTYKGILFIILSASLIFGLVYVAVRRLTARTRRLERALQQATLLHRILRHNLRNTCNVIGGNVELLTDGVDDDPERLLETIRQQNERLIELSRKSTYLRDFTEPTPDDIRDIDVATSITIQVRLARNAYPWATIHLDTPAEAPVRAHYHIGNAFEQLLENAIEHNPAPEPHVWVQVRETAEAVVCTVADDGPGMPPVERRVLRGATETPTEHSQGLGLTLVRLTVEASDGTLEVGESDHGGTRVTVRLPTGA